MAESFVKGIAENLLGNIASLLIDEVALAWGLEADVKALQQSLKTVEGVLLDAEEKQVQNPEVSGWLRELKNFCYDAEDVLDELAYEDLRKKVLKQYGNDNIMIRRFFSSSNLRRKMGHEVKKLRQRLDQIAKWVTRLKLHLSQRPDLDQAGSGSREMTYSYLDMSNVLGRNGDKDEILRFLLDGREMLSVIPIVGLPGMGKTTLAKMLYNDGSVKEHFKLRIWVCVSDKFEKKQIMVSIMKSLTRGDHSHLDLEQLQTLIRDMLIPNKFLLVLDDVWINNRMRWNQFKELLEGGVAGSQVIVTTRDGLVADTVGTGFSYRLGSLSHEDCVSLFKKLAFQEGREESNQRLMKIGGDIVKKCGGIPLAVKIIGALLFNKIDVRYWKYIRDSETWKLEPKETDILPALKLSYDQLPSYLKPCFAICSLYPKDYLFNGDELIQTWMANGLLQSSNEQRDMEDIGVQYIKELYSRSFFQDLEDDGCLMKFRMHDLVHDLARLISENECFVVNTLKKIPDEIRYLAIPEMNSLNQRVLGILKKNKNLRTIVFPYGTDESVVNPTWISWISSSKRMRMLDFGLFRFEVLSSSIGNLKHLRSLDLSYSSIKRLPDVIWKLHNVLYLNLLYCYELEELPSDIRNLIKLRDLKITTKQKRLPDDGIRCLRSLRHLLICDCSNLECLSEDIQHLTSLRSLEVDSCDRLISLPLNLMSLNALEILRINNCKQFNWTEEGNNQDIRLSLRYLGLQHLPRVGILPQWLQKSSRTLQHLIVHYCKFSCFPEWLKDFTSLEKLEIFGGRQFVSLPKEVHHLISLQELNISDCPFLFSLPEGMRLLTSLKRLKIFTCPILSKRCKRHEGKDWHKIAHVPYIIIDHHVYMNKGDLSTV